MFLVQRQQLNVKVVPMSEVPLTDLVSNQGTHEPIVLVVDDERLIADTLSAIFTKIGFETMTAYDGKSALRLAAQSAPAILVSDVCMPGMDGVALGMAVSNALPECKVLLLSAHAHAAEQVIEACDLGYDFHFIAKPVHPVVLVSRVSELLANAKRPAAPATCRTTIAHEPLLTAHSPSH